MRKPRPLWQVRWPAEPLPYAFFISHVSEDNKTVKALATEIRSLSGAGGQLPLGCYLDLESWEVGNDILGVIKTYIPKSEYLVVWATPAYLANDRGWVWMELAYAELLEASLNLPGVNIRLPYIVPVFQGVTAQQIARTPLLNYWHRNLFADGRKLPIKYVAQRLIALYQQEARKRADARG